MERYISLCAVTFPSAFLLHGRRWKLDPLSENDLYCLHFVYIPRISRALDAFTHGWINHAITTEQCMTPLQMFTSGSLLHAQSIQLDSFDGDVDSTLEMDASGVGVPPISSPLTTSQEDELKSLINPLQDSSNYGIELYEHGIIVYSIPAR